MKKTIKAYTLVIILVVSFVASMSLVKGQISASTSSTPTTDPNLHRQLDNMFLAQLGLYSNITEIQSSLKLSGNIASPGYAYEGNISFGSNHYFVQSDYLVQRSTDLLSS